jgi:hypothetical protein
MRNIQLLRTLKEVSAQLAWCNREFGPHASTNLVLKKLGDLLCVSSCEETEPEQAAIAYWQDKLAKFFPTSKGPTSVEINMFVAGFKAGEDQ